MRSPQVLQPCIEELQVALECLRSALSPANPSDPSDPSDARAGHVSIDPRGGGKRKTALYIEAALDIRGLTVSLEQHPMEAWLAARAGPLQQAAATRQLWERMLSSFAQGKLGSETGSGAAAAASTSRAEAAPAFWGGGGSSAAGGGGGGLPSHQGAIGQMWAGVERAVNTRSSGEGQGSERDKGSNSGVAHGVYHGDRMEDASDGGSSTEGDSGGEEDLDHLVRFKSIFQVRCFVARQEAPCCLDEAQTTLPHFSPRLFLLPLYETSGR
jgi:hypothetical protein